MAVSADLMVSGLSMMPGQGICEASVQRTPAQFQHLRKMFSTSGAETCTERYEHSFSGDPAVCSPLGQQRGQIGQPPRRSWYRPGKVPEAKHTCRDRSCCPWRWKNLCQADERSSSGSMCLAHKLRVCQRIVERERNDISKLLEDRSDVARIAQQATLGVKKKEKLSHDIDKPLLSSQLSRAQRPSSAPAGRQLGESSRGMTAAPTTLAPQSQSDSSTKGQTAEHRQQQHTGSDRSYTLAPAAAQRVRPQSAGTVRSSVPSLQLPRSPAAARPQSAGAVRSSAPVLRQRPRSAVPSEQPSLGSALRVGTMPDEMERTWRHRELRIHNGARGSKENGQAWEGVENRLKALERHHRLPTPSQQSSKYSRSGTETCMLHYSPFGE